MQKDKKSQTMVYYYKYGNSVWLANYKYGNSAWLANYKYGNSVWLANYMYGNSVWLAKESQSIDNKYTNSF